VVALGVAYLIFHMIRAKRAEDNEFIPPEVDNPPEIDGIMIGRYYGQAERRKCVTTMHVEEGDVIYRIFGIEGVQRDPIAEFIKRFTKYPNGCDFTDDGQLP
jgi:hypothetical protein